MVLYARALAPLVALAVALRAASAAPAALDASATPRLLQTADETSAPPPTRDPTSSGGLDLSNLLTTVPSVLAPVVNPDSPAPATAAPTVATDAPAATTLAPTSTEPTSPTPVASSAAPESTTVAPTPTTVAPSPEPLTLPPIPLLTTLAPEPTTVAPTPEPTTVAPSTPEPTTVAPTPEPSTVAPTSTPEPTTVAPVPTTVAPAPTPEPTTAAPVATPEPTTVAPAPSPEPTTVAPSPEPTTVAPSPEPTTLLPIPLPTSLIPLPTSAAPEPTTVAPAPSPEPTTVAPAPSPEPTTVAPSPEPTTLLPIPLPTSAAPEPTTVAPAPSPEPTTGAPSPVPTTAGPAPSPEPTTAGPAPSPEPTTAGPTSVPSPEPTTAGPTSAPSPEPTTAGPTSSPSPTTPGPTSAPSPEPTTAGPTSAPEPTTAGPTSSPSPTTPGPTSAPSPEPTTAGPTSAPEPTTKQTETSAPPLVTIIPATEDPLATPAPSVTKKSEDPVTEPVDNSQANKKDIITFNSNSTDETDAPIANPFEIKEIDTQPPKNVVLDIRDDTDKTAAPKLYVRGDTKTAAPSSGSGSDGSAESGGTSAPNIIGGSRRNTATTAESILSSSSQSFHDFLRYAASAFSGISVALLLFFHFVSLDATLTWTSSLWSPNTWEFILYVTYLQQMASVSQLTLLKTPYYLWDYADSFAWTNFLIQQSTSSDGRRLETIVLGGVVAYSDRIGINESKIVYHAVVGFAVVLAVLLVLFLVIAIFAKRKAEQALDDPMNLHNSSQSVHRLRSASIRTLGLCVLIWYFALYPLSTYASFEISMEIQSQMAVASALLVSIIAIGVVCFGVLAWSGRVIMQKSKDELLQFENMATWGSLYAEFSFRSRMFFILGALVQIVTGIIVGTMDSDPTQLIIVIIIEILYLVAVFVLTPFAEVLVLRFTYGLGLLKVINFSLAFAFLNSNTMSGSGRNNVANAFIGINTIVIIGWFIRQLIVFSTYIRAWSARTSFIEESNNAHDDSTAKYETRTATDSEVYASVATARHGEGAASAESDDYHKAQREVPF